EGAGGAAAFDGVFGVEEFVEGRDGAGHGGLELLLQPQVAGEALGLDEVLVGRVFEETGERAEVEALDGAGGVEQVGEVLLGGGGERSGQDADHVRNLDGFWAGARGSDGRDANLRANASGGGEG